MTDARDELAEVIHRGRTSVPLCAVDSDESCWPIADAILASGVLAKLVTGTSGHQSDNSESELSSIRADAFDEGFGYASGGGVPLANPYRKAATS